MNLVATDLVVEFPIKSGIVQAVSHVNLTLTAGVSTGMVGESGCGKSSVGRALIQLPPPTSGEVSLDDVPLRPRRGRKAGWRRDVQMIFQDPIGSLSPRRAVHKLVREGVQAWGEKISDEEIRSLLTAVGLDPDEVWNKLPAQMSGGQCQRVNIARALALKPKFIVCDEIVSALDVSVQARVLNLLRHLQQEFGFGLLFISHDMAVVKNVTAELAVMYLGKIVEVGETAGLTTQPLHPYTWLLLASSDGRDAVMPDGTHDIDDFGRDLPSAVNPPAGCRFQTRCPFAREVCRSKEPELNEVTPGRKVACHFPLNYSVVEDSSGANEEKRTDGSLALPVGEH